jgi:hypothetical protein
MTNMADPTPFSTVRADYPLRPSAEASRKQHIIDRVHAVVHESVKDVGRVAQWTVQQLVDHGIQPDIIVHAVRRQQGVAEIRTVFGRGWNFFTGGAENRDWCLLLDARVVSYRREGSDALIINRDPNDFVVDFESGSIQQSVADYYGIRPVAKEDVGGLLRMCGVVLEPATPAQDPIMKYFDDVRDPLIEYQAAAGWDNAFVEFLDRNGLPEAPLY